MAVIGIVLAAVTQGAVFDITGGILTTVGLIFAGFTTASKRRQVLREFRKEIEKGGKRLEEEVSTNLKTYITNLRSRIDENFIKFDLLLEQEGEQVEKLTKRSTDITARLAVLQTAVNEAAAPPFSEEE